MSTFRISEVRAAAANSTKQMQKTASIMLSEAVEKQTIIQTYDIFLSHAFIDAELILGVKVKLESYGHSVYVDWLDDHQLDRTSVTPETAKTLRQRMACCRCLFYSTTEASTNSKWMPWECGYVDGKCGRSAILPLTENGTENYRGQEYLGIYPYIMEAPNKGGKNLLWVHWTPDFYCSFDEWLRGIQPSRH